ncbi:MAG: hypothetical protein ACI7YS_12815 [Flavobacterium sp.]
MTIVVKRFFIIMGCFLFRPWSACGAVPPSPYAKGPGGGGSPDMPLDGHILILVIVSLLYGVYKIVKLKNKKASS